MPGLREKTVINNSIDLEEEWQELNDKALSTLSKVMRADKKSLRVGARTGNYSVEGLILKPQVIDLIEA